LDENCPGPIIKKDKTNDRISKLMYKIRPEREPRRKSKRQIDDSGDTIGALPEKDSGIINYFYITVQIL